MKKCRQGYYYCYTDEKCKPIPQGLKMTARFSGGGKEPEETGIDVPTNGNNQNGNGNGNGDSNGGSNGGGVSEGTLHKWFKGSKSKDGKGGWVNVVTGGTCASDEPGEGTPKCVSSAKRASMTKAERLSAQRRKKAADPEQQAKSGAAKPTYVSTDKPKKKMNEAKEKDHEYSMARSQLSTVINAANRLKKKMEKGEGEVEAWVQSKITKAADYLDSAADYVDSGEMKKEEVEVTEAKDKPGKGSGKKDACYHKVKSRYSVWPSAYASGALVKCRKVGASNWGNKSESYDFSNWRDDFQATEYEFTDIIKPEPLKGETLEEKKAQKCWPGYEKKGTKKMFGKTYNNCVKKEEKEETNIGGGNLKKLTKKAVKRIDADVDGDVDSTDMKSPETGEFIPSPDGKKKIKPKVRFEQSDWRTEFDESVMPAAIDPKAHRQQQRAAKVRNLAQKGATEGEREAAERKTKGPKMFGEDWQKVNKSDKTDGMSPAAVKAYRRENPGSKLKTAVTGDPKPGSKDAKRRKSFCARSKGQQDMHNIDCSKTPDKPVCKARRRWKC